MKRNGYRINWVNLFQVPSVKVQFGIRFALAVLAFALGNYVALALAVFMPIIPKYSTRLGFKPEFDLTGLEGENLMLVKDLQKRFKTLEISDDVKKVLVEAVRATLKPLSAEGLDEAKLKELLGDDDKGIRSILLAQGAAIKALQEVGDTAFAGLDLRGQVEKWQKAHKDVIAEIRSGKKRDVPTFEFDVRAAVSPMTFSGTVTGANAGKLPVPQYEAGIRDLRRVMPTLWDMMRKGRTSQASYIWVNKKKAADTGEAAFIGEGVAKPKVSFELVPEVSNAKKIAVALKTSIELLDDIDGMVSFIENELKYQLYKKLNDTLMAGVLSSTVPAGITTFAQTYSLVGVSTTDPNNFDAIRAAVAQIRVNYIGEALTVFINPVDAANMDLAKADTSGVYMLPPFSTADGKTVAGATVVEDNNVTAGYVLVAALDLFTLLIYKDLTINWGWENDDFTKNLITVIAEMRVHSFHSENDAQAFVYDTFANIKTEITAA